MCLGDQAMSGAPRVSPQESCESLFRCLQVGSRHWACTVCWGQTWDSTALDPSQRLGMIYCVDRGKTAWSPCVNNIHLLPPALIDYSVSSERQQQGPCFPYSLCLETWLHSCPGTMVTTGSVDKVCVLVTMNSFSCLPSSRTTLYLRAAVAPTFPLVVSHFPYSFRKPREGAANKWQIVDVTKVP